MIIDGVLWVILISQLKEGYGCARVHLGEFDGAAKGGL